ncbi:MAG: ABC transporter permease, partial [Pseudomonadota bacterium]
MKLAFAFARRELRTGLRGFGIFLACLALGVAAIAAVGSVRASIEAGLAQEGAALLGGDAEIEFTYRFAEPEERAWMDAQATAVSEIADFRSLAVAEIDGQTERALTQVKAVDSAYPLIGEMLLDPAMPLDTALAGDGNPGTVMERVLADRMGLSTGDTFRLGTQDFTLMALIVNEPDSSSGGFGLGPRTLVLLDDLANSSLLEPGTLFSTKYR